MIALSLFFLSELVNHQLHKSGLDILFEINNALVVQVASVANNEHHDKLDPSHILPVLLLSEVCKDALDKVSLTANC
jgi:hypothetical protein